jgi:type IV pilus assembly protein PilA
MLQQFIRRLREQRSSGPTEGEGEEAGFTLIELMVVLLIMAILIAIAIPTFLGVTSSAKNRAAQSNLRNALTAVQSYEAGNQTYSGLNTSVLSTREPSLTWTTGAVTKGSNQVSIDVGSGGNSVILAAAASDGVCYGIFIYNGIYNGTSSSSLDGSINSPGTYYTGESTSSSCSASGLDTLTTNTTPKKGYWSTAGFPSGLT